MRHLHGPRRLDVGPGEVVLIALVRDGSYYLDAFYRYYRVMGVWHFVCVDNGSQDDTIAKIKTQEGAVIDRAPGPLA
ncbi:glycosyltransferase family 2 protein [Sulfitobacter aestuarii]|uniref:Glycosyltransferase family 2 protein n=1 Tax=Sulfitobacter aestuarii TaxID=2161676 RepID=A0ABW5U0I3_9RHOB